MLQPISCRLCINICHGHRSFYDEDGRRNEVYELTTTYFTPMLLNLEHDKHLAVICMECWRHIFEFHTFQQSVFMALRIRGEVYKRTAAVDNSEKENPLEEPTFNTSVPPDEQSRSELFHGTEVSTNTNASDSPIFCHAGEEDQPESQLNEADHNTSLPISISSDESCGSEALVNMATSPCGDVSCRVGYTIQSSEAVVSSGKDGPLKELELNTALSVATVTERSHDSEVITRKPASTYSPDCANASSDEESEAESDDKWEEFDDPVGVFAGGEFNKSASKNTESEWAVENCSSSDKMLLAENVVKAGQVEAEAKKYHPEEPNKENLITNSISFKRNHKTALEFDVSETEGDEMFVAESPVKTRPEKTKVNKFRSEDMEPITANFTKNKGRIKKIYKCAVCDKDFTRQLDLREHIASHMGKIMYACPFCPTKTTHRSSLYAHLKTKHHKKWEELKKDKGNSILNIISKQTNV